SAFTLAPLAGAYLSAGRLSEALAVTDSLLRRTGPTPARLELRARILDQLGRREAAVATLRSALRAPDGGSWERWRLLAENLMARGRQQEAAAALDSAELAAAGDTLALKQVAEARRKIAESGVSAAPRRPAAARLEPTAMCHSVAECNGHSRSPRHPAAEDESVR